MSEKTHNLEERSLSMASEGEETVEVFVEVPPDHNKGGNYLRYTVQVPKEKMSSAVRDNTFPAFWEEVEQKVMEDVNEV